MRLSSILSIVSCGATLLCAGAAEADPVADFYQGKDVTIIISSSPGGGYDTLARAIAKHIGSHLPGHPTFTIKNMPGAGGIVAANYLYNLALKDGTVIGGVQNNTPFEPLLGTKQARYEPTKFNWLGSPSVETGILVTWNNVAASSVDDLKTHQITVGSSGANSTPTFYAKLLNEVLGTRLKIIVGYPGQTEAFLAMERGEIDGYSSVFYSTLMATKPDWLRDHKIKALVQYGPQREKALGDVPFLADLVTDENDKLLIEAAIAPLALGRPYLMPPQVPPERLEAMRQAMSDTFADAQFLEDASELGLGIDAPRSGAQIQAVMDRTYAIPPTVIDRLRKLTQD
jgi:tripartite-type tricarboxylate transporter receptor subunit TctC